MPSLGIFGVFELTLLSGALLELAILAARLLGAEEDELWEELPHEVLLATLEIQ